MPFKERTREFWFKVADNKCQYESYTERKGFCNCGNRASHIHHIIGEAEQLRSGEDPEHSVALPLCVHHHVRNLGDILGDPNSSFHPDMGQAYGKYRDWKHDKNHMNSIQGKTHIDYSDSPFADAAKGHREKLDRGERYISGDERSDQYYLQKMEALAMLYLANHPEEHKPDTKPHPQSGKSGHWWSKIFGGE